MMLARPPEPKGDTPPQQGCERHPRLRIVLWLLWLAAALLLALFAGHGLAQATVTADLDSRQPVPHVRVVRGAGVAGFDTTGAR